MQKNRKIVVASHVPGENGGGLLPVLEQSGFTPVVVNLYAGDKIPQPKDYAALVILGGLEGVNNVELSSGMQHGLASIQDALEAEKPFLGICLGMQMLVKVAGGEVVTGDREEIGFRITYNTPDGKLFALNLTEEGKKDRFLKDMPNTISPVFQLHLATVELTEDMKYPAMVLAENDDGIVPNQIIRVGNKAYGIQSHREVTTELLNLWFDAYSSLWDFEPKVKELIRQDFNTFKESYVVTSRKIFNNWLDIVEKEQ